jgi:hypothetical protein
MHVAMDKHFATFNGREMHPSRVNCNAFVILRIEKRNLIGPPGLNKISAQS